MEGVNGASALTSSLGALLETVGFVATPRGLRLRALTRSPAPAVRAFRTPDVSPLTHAEGDTVWQAARRLHDALAARC
ncbi:hypothetical protein GCM10023238_13360 [Streptomyces heliomycini]